ncbi:UDP-N-acetylmuramate--alanine ligase [Kitasatospora sp. GP30]|uniref:Mur ligase domain-containing protein n=1 Tax=Kitasatospora sp. GP30 TaxID=3035084 RepID=UPI000CB65882|nr:Mur ligase domain-containing protein [Kitasatospora sp. GP30]MDH6138487.1 UDP-N-acetylmuramate--alanine ligase [Kitasatospora sp. GP30]
MTNDTPAYSGPPRLAAPHLVGIDTAGSGLPGLAQLLLERGARVSGSTLNDSDTTAELAKHGVRITHDHGPHLVRADMSCLVWSGRTTPTQRTELERAEQMRVPTHHYPEALAQLFHATNTTVAVAGSHSTASVAGMLTSALGHLNPAWVLRTPLVRHGVGHHSGGDLLIADLGEDGDLEEHATVSVVTAIAGAQPQHLGYETLEELEGLARRSETVVLPTWDRGTAELAARLAEAPGPRVVTVGQVADATIRVLCTRWDGRTTRLLLLDLDGNEHLLAVPLRGRHNAMAAALAFAVGRVLGGGPVDLAEGIAEFPGVERSLTVLGRQGGVTVVDSIAHHPAELAGDLKAARTLAGPRGRLIAVLEPTGWSDSVAYGNELGRQLAVADEAVLLPVHDLVGPAHPGADAGTDAIARSAAAGGLAGHLTTVDARSDLLNGTVEQQIAAVARPGDVIAVIGSGHAARLGARLLFAIGAPAASIPTDL